ncbi:MAG: hypothetical protein JSW61_12765 [Candidatus Thorarchaeota archaeon]|nr:MAG: hypothetical protein JSW61_12765 [Candidatus Thorarchaeota archaeon]
MGLDETASNISKEIDSTRNLLGEMGELVLRLIYQGCRLDDELTRFGSITQECLDVRITVLRELDLVRDDDDGYEITPAGEKYLEIALGWNI